MLARESRGLSVVTGPVQAQCINH